MAVVCSKTHFSLGCYVLCPHITGADNDIVLLSTNCSSTSQTGYFHASHVFIIIELYTAHRLNSGSNEGIHHQVNYHSPHYFIKLTCTLELVPTFLVCRASAETSHHLDREIENLMQQTVKSNEWMTEYNNAHCIRTTSSNMQQYVIAVVHHLQTRYFVCISNNQLVLGFNEVVRVVRW